MRIQFFTSRNVFLSGLFLSVMLFMGCSESENNILTVPVESENLSNRVWQVSESDGVAAGALYVFLSEGTLIIASENNKPGVGFWRKTDSGLEVVEEGITYQVDAEVNGDELTLIYHNPAGETKIKLVVAR